MQRRTFVKNTTAMTASAIVFPVLANMNLKDKKFKMCLKPSAVGIDIDQKGLVNLAAKHNFSAITASAGELTQMSTAEKEALMESMKDRGLSWGASDLPVDFRKGEAKFREDLNKLPEKAAALQSVGCTRSSTWIMPTHKELSYRENFKQHTSRLKQIANILGHHNIRLGLEYVGPKTLMAREKFSFIRTMQEGKELTNAIDEPNVGFLLDSFHWFCAGDSAADILTLDNKDVITVDLNDARSGFTADEQIDGKRELPAATGVIDIKAFLSALIQIGYDGPVRAEPFNQTLRDMDNEAAAKATYEAMKKAFEMV